VAAGIGAIWVLGRLLYMVLYVQDPKKRAFGYALQGLAGLALLIGALVGVVTRLLAAPMA
jgi:glutathione S-transferase